MTKEEKVKLEYSKFEVDETLSIDENGWFKMYLNSGFITPFLGGSELSDYEFDNGKLRVRLKSLSGIEDNNGWVKINSVDDLPTEAGLYYYATGNEYHGTRPLYLSQIQERYVTYSNTIWAITHYKKLNEEKGLVYDG